MAFQTGFSKYEGTTAATDHAINDQILIDTKVDDVLLASVVMDRGKVMTPWGDGWTELKNTINSGIGHIVMWKRCTVDNEIFPDIVLSGAVTASVEIVKFIGCSTSSSPVGATSDNDGGSTTPTYLSITPQAKNSAIIWFGGLDRRNMLTVGNKAVLMIADSAGACGITAYEFSNSINPTGDVIGTVDSGDGWQTFVVEILDNVVTPRIPTYFENMAGAVIDSGLYTPDVDFRSEYMLNDTTIEGDPRANYTFDSNNITSGTTTLLSDVDGSIVKIDNDIFSIPSGMMDTYQVVGATLNVLTGNQIGAYEITGIRKDSQINVDHIFTELESDLEYTITTTSDLIEPTLDVDHNIRTFRATGTVPTGMVVDEFYYIAMMNAQYCTVYSAAGTQTLAEGDLSLTGVAGTCSLEECGIALQISNGTEYNQIDAGLNANKNVRGSAHEFTTPIDLTDRSIGLRIKSGGSNMAFFSFMFMDINGNWKNWKLAKDQGEEVDFSQTLTAPDGNENFASSGGVFDHTQVKYFIPLYKDNSYTSTDTMFFSSYSDINILVVLGGDSVEAADIKSLQSSLWTQLKDTSTSSVIQYSFLHSLQFGNGTDDLRFEDTNKSIEFPPLSDGINTFGIYLASLGVSWKLKDTDTLDFTNSQLCSGKPFVFLADPTTNINADLSFAGMQVIQGTPTLKEGEIHDSITFIGGDGITHNDATISNCTVDGSLRTEGALILTTTHNITDSLFKNMGNAIEIDTAGDYELSDIKFENNTNDINVTATTGTVTINVLDGGDTPTYTTSGATVNIVSGQVTLTVTVKDIVTGSIIPLLARVYVLADTGGSLAVDTVIIDRVLTDANGQASDTRSYPTSQPIKGWVRKASSTPFYKTAQIAGTIDNVSGLSLSIQMISDE